MVEIELDGKKVEVPPGSMVMDAANKLGTYIPHFCYHKKLSIAANCRMCLVEVEKAPKPLPACATPVSPGMIVRSHSDKAVQAQKSVMEFLLINHPLDCPICDQGGECQLQDLAVGYGKSNSRYDEEKRVVAPKEAGPLISMEEMSRCIQCTRCVRFGQEVAGVMEFGMVGRGEHSEITTFVGKSVDSEVSGNMIDLCPVGALTSKPFRYSARPWELQRRRSVSPHDSLGSNLIVQVKGGKVMRVLPLENENINECWLSDKDRFSYEALDNASRLVNPMIKQGGQWVDTDWQTALEYVAHGLRNIRHEHGADSIAAVATAHSTVEELFLLQKAMRGFGVNAVDFRLRQTDFALDGQVVPSLGMPIAELSNLQRVLVVGSFLRKDHPLAATRLRAAVKSGAKLSIVHGSFDDNLIPTANRFIAAPSDWLAALSEIVVAVAAAKNAAVPAGFDGIEAGEVAKAIAATLVVDNADRLTVPMIKQGGQWAETDWQTALEYVAHGLRNIKHEHGADSIAAAATAHSTVEELYLLQKAMRGLGTEHIDFRLRQGDFALDGAVTPWLGMPIAELSNVASAFVIGSNLRKDHPLVATRLRNAIKNGAKLAVLGGLDDELLMTTAAKIVAAPSDWLAALSDVVAAVAAAKEIDAPAGFNNIAVTDNAKAIAKTFAQEGAVVLLGNAVSHHPQAAAIHAAAQWIADTTGAKFGYLVEAANTGGGSLVNATSNQDLFATPKKAYVLLNAEPELDAANPQQARAALDGAEMVVVMSAFKHGFDYADVMLPIAPFSETAGTFVNCEGRAQSFNGTVKPLGETRPAWKVLRVLGNLLGVAGFDYDTAEAVRDEVLGRGVTDLSGKLNNIAKGVVQAAAYKSTATNAGALERVTDVPIYFTDALARRSEPLQRTADANMALVTLPRALAAELNVVAGDRVQVTQGSGSAILVADIDARLPANAVRVAAGHPSTATLGAMFGPIAVQKAGEAA